MRIGPMTKGDVGEVSDLLRACFDWLADREGFTPAQRAFLTGQRSDERTIRQEARCRAHLVARAAGVILGMAVVDGNELARLYVHPRFHRRGVGRALFEAAESMIRQAGHHEMAVGALVESAVRFYESMGMAVVGCVEYEPSIFPDRKVTLLSKPLR